MNVSTGLAIAPDNFGKLSNALLVANYGDGTITVFDQNTKEAIRFLKDPKGNPVTISGL